MCGGCGCGRSGRHWFLLWVLHGFARIFVRVCVVLCVSWSCACRLHWSGCMNVAWAMLWGGSRSTKPCVLPFKVAGGDDERYLVCAAVAAAVVPDAIGSSYVFWKNLCSCVRSSMRVLKLWMQIALEWLHECCMGYVVGRKPEHETLFFFRIRWLEATMKGTSSVRRLRLRSFRTRLTPPMCLARIFIPVCVVLCVSLSCACRSHWNGCMNVAWAMLWGGSQSTKPRVFPCKWRRR